MTYLSLLDKIKILFMTLFDFKGIFIFSIFMTLLTVVYLMKKITAKRYTIGISLSLVLLFLISILSNLKIFNKLFDNFMTIFFNGIYFPSIYIYISTLIIVLVSFIVSIVNIKTKKVYKVINRIMFVLNNIIFVIILNIVAKNKIDVFSANSLFTNTNLVGILEISMVLFLIWIASLFVAYVTNSICDRLSRKKELIKEEVTVPVVETVTNTVVKEPVLEASISNVIEEPVTNVVVEEPIKNKYIYENNSYNNIAQEVAQPKYAFNYSESNNNIINAPVIEVTNNKVVDNYKASNNATFDDILYGRIPIVYSDGDSTIKEYNITNPQTIYDNIKEEVATNNEVEEIPSVVTFDKPEETIFSRMVNEDIKEKKLESMIDGDTLSFDEISSDNNYTIEDYKKIINMLNSLKNRSIDHNISIDDAVAISLISNYSIDDCLKLKDILESTLN